MNAPLSVLMRYHSSFLADDEEEMEEAPEGFIIRDFKGKDGYKYRIQVSLEDCTGCGLCVEACPASALVMKDYEDQQEQAVNWAFAMTLRQKRKSNEEKLGTWFSI